MKVTIGLPIYNAKPYLEMALRSIFAQTYQDWELVIVDDGSTDGSLDLVCGIRDSRVTVHADGINRGLSSRLNQIIELAGGEYLARMDADDIMHPERLARQVEMLDRRPDLDLVDCAMCSIDECNRPSGVRGLDGFAPTPRNVLKHVVVHHAAIVARTQWCLRNKYRNDFVRAEDHELWCRTAASSKFGRVTENLYFVREGSVSLRKYLKTGQTDRRIFALHGPSLVGGLETGYLVARSYMKSLIYMGFSALRMQETLVRRRNRPLTPVEIEEASQIIRIIEGTEVPGLRNHSDGVDAWRRAIVA